LIHPNITKTILCLTFLVMTSVLWSKPLADENRNFLYNHRAHKLPINLAVFPYSSENHENNFAIYAELIESTERPYLVLNDERKITRPVVRGNGLIFPISKEDLRDGETNTFGFVTLSDEVVEMTAAQVFEFSGFVEELHLVEYLGKSNKVQPPLHPSQNFYDVEKYIIDLDMDSGSRFLEGSVTIVSTSLLNGLDEIAFDFVSADFSGAALTIQNIEIQDDSFQTIQNVNNNTTVDQSNGWVIIDIPDNLEPNLNEEIIIEIEYSGIPDSSQGAFGLNSYNRDVRSNNVPVIYSFSEPYSARSWWPCKDVTNDKALLDFIITTDNDLQAIANGELISTTPVLGNKNRYFWSHQYPIVPYLIAFCISDYEYIGGNYQSVDGMKQMPVGHYIFSESIDDRTAHLDTIQVMEFFAETFGEYPYIEEKYVTMTWGGGFGMEHSTATSTNQNDLRSSNGGGYSRRNVHELSHQWFGDLVTPVNFDHLWLNEGWATYCEALERESRFGFGSYSSYIVGIENSSINNSTPIVNSNADAFQLSLVYRKGALVLHMLRGVMGDDDFFQATRNYLANHAYGVVDTEIFETEMEAVYGEELDWFFDQWVYTDGAPEYEYLWEQNGNELTIGVNQTSGDYFEMPITFRINYSGGGSEDVLLRQMSTLDVQEFPVSGTVASVVFDPNNWIYDLGIDEVSVFSLPAPQLLTIASTPQGFPGFEINWEHPATDSIDGFLLESTTNGIDWQVVVDETVLTPELNSYVYDTIEKNVSLRLRAINGPLMSDATDPYAARAPISQPSPQVLVVDGYDRIQPWSVPNQPFTLMHGQVLHELEIPFDTCESSEVENGTISLLDYDLIVWQSSEESTVDNPFEDDEITFIQQFLDAGGSLFLSGSEIGWAHGRPASNDYEPTLYNDYLKATYESDDSDSYTLDGITGSPFENLTFAFDDTGFLTYRAEFPDEIEPVNSGQSLLNYGNSLGAAVYYEGLFPNGTAPGKLIYLGFPFETITTQSDRVEVMSRAMDFFGIEPDSNISTVDQFMIY